MALVRHADLLVVHSTSSRWVTTCEQDDVLVVLDGRVHNLPEQERAQARQLVERYRQVGDQLAAGLLGDFVIVVLDRAARTLLVARDPVGARPWYVTESSRGCTGATDLASLIDLPGVDASIDEAAAIAHLGAVFRSRGATLYRGVRTLRPGHTWVRRDGRARTFAHHQWRLAPAVEVSWDDAARRCRGALDIAVRCRLDPDAPATSELSGGLDSSAVVGTLAQLGGRHLVAGRLVFAGPAADERTYSQSVADLWGIPLVSADPWMPTIQESAEITAALRRPLPDPHFTMFGGLHRALLADGRPHCLTGLGGDDAFAPVSAGGRVVSAIQLRRWPILRQLFGAGLRHPRRAWPELLRPTLHHVAPRRGNLPGWVRKDVAARAGLADLVHERPEPVTGIAAVDERLDNLTGGYVAEILELGAIVADLTGHRSTHPFLDPRFILATYGLDPWWPTRDGATRALQVAAFADRMPRLVAERRSKAQFAEVFWPTLLQDDVVDSVRRGPLNDLGWLDDQGFDDLIGRAHRGMANAAIPLARCVSVDQWLRSL
ncbi:MAG: asparagine synthase-related protein [Acidimicrobiales bacterium]